MTGIRTVEMSSHPLVSVVISNYNYAEFVCEAIESALAQTYPYVEVVVVDDGSIDNSREVICAFRDRVIPVFKENGGQASAINAGFEKSRGDIVFFLDADDLLHDHIAGRVVHMFTAHPEAVKVQFRMQEIDQVGHPNGAIIPRSRRRFQSSDLRRYFLKHHMYTWPWTSGNAYRSSTLKNILPIPEETFRISADEYLAHTSVLTGPIVSLDEVGCSYRIHSRNNFTTRRLDIEKVRKSVALSYEGHKYLKAFADSQGFSDFPASADSFRNVTLLYHQMISFKLGRKRHPVSSDITLTLLRRGLRAVIGNPEFSVRHQLAHSLWMIAFMCSPYPVAKRLCEIRRSLAQGA